MVNRRNQWLQRMIGLGLLIMLAAGLIVIFRRVPDQVQTGQAEATAVELAQVPTKDLPVPTAMIIGTIYPTETPLPTVTPWPTPTRPQGPTVTPMLLPQPASDPAGSLIYMSVDPKKQQNQVYSVSIDEQGKLIETSKKLLMDNLDPSSDIYPAPDGSRIALVNGWGQRGIFYPDTGKGESLFHQSLDPRGIFFDWHPDNQHVLLRADENYVDIGLWLVDADTGKHVTVLMQPWTTHLTGGAVSPNGQQVVYSTKLGFTFPSELWISYIDGSEPRQLFTSGLDIVKLSWSPDGNQIAFFEDGLILLNVPDGKLRRIDAQAMSGDGLRAVWSPDSKKLAVVVSEGAMSNNAQKDDVSQLKEIFSKANIHLVDVATGADKALLNDGTTGNLDPTWSPDGKKIAFISNRSGVTELWMVNGDGTELIQLTHQGQSLRFPFWVRQAK